ncbi:Crp/Fnr family transcriptional regulator [Thioalkalivibrio sp. XN279]|uniref:Crp/Fnr family transcriptional regulator n=1 Tax=Thioalkalivibrio sp. XN279 TaxID=2714953 RepID=UPI00140CD684|nr:Crp/Fnr family transcriptional regulator [Thioalkalivibrio sp. XN279]
MANIPLQSPVSEANTLVASLPRGERKQLLSLCEPFAMRAGDVLCDVDTPYRHAYFPTSGLVSLVSVLHDHKPMDMALIGQDGMLGATLVLGIDTVPMKAVVHAPGSALRIRAPNLRRRIQVSPVLRKIISRYLYTRLVELSLVGGCIRYHRIEQRLARALLLAADRMADGRFYLTHSDLADMLGVRRSSITIAAGDLQGRGLINYTRGNVRVLDRNGLEAMSCECYEVFQTRQRH